MLACNGKLKQQNSKSENDKFIMNTAVAFRTCKLVEKNILLLNGNWNGKAAKIQSRASHIAIIKYPMWKGLVKFNWTNSRYVYRYVFHLIKLLLMEVSH